MKKRHVLKVSAVLFVLCLVLFALVGTASAEVEDMSLEDLTSKASTIVRGTVSSVEPYWNGDQTMIYTSVTVSVQDYLKGESGAKEITIEVPGGSVGEITLWVSDTPTFEEGQEVVLFLREEYFQIVGWFQGKFTVVDDMVVEKGVSVDQFAGQIKAIMDGSVTWAEISSAPEESIIETLKEFGLSPLGSSEKEPKDDTQYRGAVGALAAETCPPTLEDFYGGIKWPGSCPTVDYEVYENTGDTTGEGAAIQASADTWTDVNGSCFTFNYAGATTRSAPTRDSHNVLRWGSTGGSIATTYIWYDWSDNILENDVVFEDAYAWSADPICPPDRMDVQNIATHELGHWLLLVDLYKSCNSELTMYGYGAYGETKSRTLHSSDEDGIRYIYPGASPPLSIDVYTDQASYSAGETQIFGMDLANPGPVQPVRLVLLLWTPFGVFPVIDVDFSLPTGNFPNPSLFQWTVSGIPTGSYAWIGVLIPVGGDPSFDVAWWAFTGGASSQHTLPAEEVLKGLAEIDLNFDEYDSASSQGTMPVEEVLKGRKGLDLYFGE